MLERNGIIIACDFVGLDRLSCLVGETGPVPGVTGYKIGFTLALAHGLDKVVDCIRQFSEKPIIYDHQKAGNDIPAMGEQFAKVCSTARIDAAILFPFAGPKTEVSWIHALVNVGIEPIVGGFMTHASFLEDEDGYVSKSAPERIFELAHSVGVSRFVLPATRPTTARALSSLLPDSATFFMPGFGTQGGEIETIAKAVPIRRVSPIIGSSIYGASSPRTAAEVFSAELERYQ